MIAITWHNDLCNNVTLAPTRLYYTNDHVTFTYAVISLNNNQHSHKQHCDTFTKQNHFSKQQRHTNSIGLTFRLYFCTVRELSEMQGPNHPHSPIPPLLCCLMTPGLRKDIWCHDRPYFFILANQQTRCQALRRSGLSPWWLQMAT